MAVTETGRNQKTLAILAPKAVTETDIWPGCTHIVFKDNIDF